MILQRILTLVIALWAELGQGCPLHGGGGYPGEYGAYGETYEQHAVSQQEIVLRNYLTSKHFKLKISNSLSLPKVGGLSCHLTKKPDTNEYQLNCQSPTLKISTLLGCNSQRSEIYFKDKNFMEIGHLQLLCHSAT